MTNKILKLHGATISVESEENKGTTFTVEMKAEHCILDNKSDTTTRTFPSRAYSSASNVTRESHANNVLFRRALIAEDSDLNRGMMVVVLKKYFEEVKEVCDLSRVTDDYKRLIMLCI